jgi:hypothetical protein
MTCGARNGWLLARSLTQPGVAGALHTAEVRRLARYREGVMKKVIELLLCILHPVAVVLIWINLVMRDDLGLIAKLTWAIASIVPFVPFVYVLTGNDFL